MTETNSVVGGLGYLFWHAPAPAASRQEYEAALAKWQDALAAHPPPGFVRGWTWRLPVPPWLAGWPSDGVYLDVYVVADFAALGALNAQAPTGALQMAHDGAAGRAGYGSGALFACRSGTPAPQPGPTLGRQVELRWYDKPAGISYPEVLEHLSGEGQTVWLRQMVLGAGPEILVTGGAPEPSLASAWNASATMLASSQGPGRLPSARVR